MKIITKIELLNKTFFLLLFIILLISCQQAGLFRSFEHRNIKRNNKIGSTIGFGIPINHIRIKFFVHPMQDILARLISTGIVREMLAKIMSHIRNKWQLNNFMGLFHASGNGMNIVAVFKTCCWYSIIIARTQSAALRTIWLFPRTKLVDKQQQLTFDASFVSALNHSVFIACVWINKFWACVGFVWFWDARVHVVWNCFCCSCRDTFH